MNSQPFPFSSEASLPLPPAQPPSVPAQSFFDASSNASRKSCRRGDAGEVPSSAAAATAVQNPQLPPPPPLAQLLADDAVGGGVEAPASTASWEGWGASLSPKGYTHACRAVEQMREAQPFASCSNASSGAHTTTTTASANGPTLPLHRDPEAEHPSLSQPQPQHRVKRRRMEQISFTSLRKEVFMYLDAVAATQEELSQGSAGEAEEDAHAEEEQQQHRAGSSSRRPLNGASLVDLSRSENTASAQRAPGRAASQVSVDGAVLDALRVLRACWEYRGAPHDAFEPLRLLSPVTAHLLLTYGHHTLTRNGDYVVLRGGAEQLLWVGCLYGILTSYVYRHRSPTDGSHEHHSTGDPLTSISRILLLNCHSFGWLDHVGSDEYERSHRRLHQAREALVSLLEDERYVALGQRALCPLCSCSMVGGDAATAVVLGDTIVMEGGVPSLGLAPPRDTFTAHYQYGRGIACCVPERYLVHRRQRAGDGNGSSTAATHAQQHQHQLHHASGDGSRASGAYAGGRSQLCAVHRPTASSTSASASSSRAASRRESPQWTAQAQPAEAFLVEEEHVGGGLPLRRGRTPHLSHMSPPSPTQSFSLSTPDYLSPMCCGTCRAAGVLGQAVLLGPTGPLIIHLQFEEREWLEAAAPLLANGVGGGLAPYGWPIAETTAVCPAPLLNTSSLCTDPASALAAVLYAQMQGHGTAGMPRGHGSGRGGLASSAAPPPPLTSISGGAVSLAELVEWLVRLLHAPPPALVVEWHSSSPSSPYPMSTEDSYAEAGPRGYSSTPGVGSPTSAGSRGSPLPTLPPHVVVTPYTEEGPGSGVTTAANTMAGYEAGNPQVLSPVSSSSMPEQPQQAYGATAYIHSGTSSPPPPPAPHPSVPLGMSVRPRQPVVPQLLETYADVFLSRPSTAGLVSETAAAARAAQAVLSGGGPLGTHYDLSATLTAAASAANLPEQDHVLLEWLLAAREALQPCDATAYFDGVERPLVLAKQLEVVTEGERYVNANSVATSLQFRPRLSGS